MRRAQLNARSSRPSGRVADQPATGDRFHPVAKSSVAPMAIDMLNMPAQIQLQRETFGGLSEQIHH
jgi:hypothetical protein